MAYRPGSGIRKPLKMLENPISPEIKSGPPIFKDAGKHWEVGVDVLREIEHYPNFYSYAVLKQPRNYNQTRYGVSSHRTIVNAEFRPPVVNRLDQYPLSRVPVGTVTTARINPKLPEDFGDSVHTTSGMRFTRAAGAISRRKKSGIFNTCPIEETEIVDISDYDISENYNPFFAKGMRERA